MLYLHFLIVLAIACAASVCAGETEPEPFLKVRSRRSPRSVLPERPEAMPTDVSERSAPSPFSMQISVGQTIALTNSNQYGPNQGYATTPFSNASTSGRPKPKGGGGGEMRPMGGGGGMMGMGMGPDSPNGFGTPPGGGRDCFPDPNRTAFDLSSINTSNGSVSGAPSFPGGSPPGRRRRRTGRNGRYEGRNGWSRWRYRDHFLRGYFLRGPLS